MATTKQKQVIMRLVEMLSDDDEVEYVNANASDSSNCFAFNPKQKHHRAHRSSRLVNASDVHTLKVFYHDRDRRRHEMVKQHSRRTRGLRDKTHKIDLEGCRCSQLQHPNRQLQYVRARTYRLKHPMNGSTEGASHSDAKRMINFLETRKINVRKLVSNINLHRPIKKIDIPKLINLVQGSPCGKLAKAKAVDLINAGDIIFDGRGGALNDVTGQRRARRSICGGAHPLHTIACLYQCSTYVQEKRTIVVASDPVSCFEVNGAIANLSALMYACQYFALLGHHDGLVSMSLTRVFLSAAHQSLSVKWRILLSGDVELNPGPSQCLGNKVVVVSKQSYCSLCGARVNKQRKIHETSATDPKYCAMDPPVKQAVDTFVAMMKTAKVSTNSRRVPVALRMACSGWTVNILSQMLAADHALFNEWEKWILDDANQKILTGIPPVESNLHFMHPDGTPTKIHCSDKKLPVCYTLYPPASNSTVPSTVVSSPTVNVTITTKPSSVVNNTVTTNSSVAPPLQSPPPAPPVAAPPALPPPPTPIIPVPPVIQGPTHPMSFVHPTIKSFAPIAVTPNKVVPVLDGLHFTKLFEYGDEQLDTDYELCDEDNQLSNCKVKVKECVLGDSVDVRVLPDQQVERVGFPYYMERITIKPILREKTLWLHSLMGIVMTASVIGFFMYSASVFNGWHSRVAITLFSLFASYWVYRYLKNFYVVIRSSGPCIIDHIPAATAAVASEFGSVAISRKDFDQVFDQRFRRVTSNINIPAQYYQQLRDGSKFVLWNHLQLQQNFLMALANTGQRYEGMLPGRLFGELECAKRS